jgi:glycosyltransferase involved in cell wall biosynthesis
VHDAWDVRIFHKECRSLAHAGYEVIELTNEAADAVQDGVRIRGLGTCRNRLHRITTKMLTIAREAFRLKANVYHIHDPELLPLAVMLRACGKCVIYDIHEDLPRTILYKYYIPAWLRVPLMRLTELIENAAARAMSGLVAATPAIGDRFRAFHPNVAVVSNFPVLSELACSGPGEWSQRRHSIASIGGIAEERGIGELLAAMEQLPDTKANLELAGWFAYPALEKELTRSPSWRHVTFWGLLNRAGIVELLGGVRAGLAIYHPEPNYLRAQPTKLFEYMSVGIPVIASDFPLWRSIIAAAGCGLLVDPCDPSSIAEAITYLLTHDAEAEAMGQRGRAAVERQYNWEIEEGHLLGFYASLLHVTSDNVPALKRYAGS